MFFALQLLSHTNEKKIKMYIFKTCDAICENFVRAQTLKVRLPHHISAKRSIQFQMADQLFIRLLKFLLIPTHSSALIQ